MDCYCHSKQLYNDSQPGLPVEGSWDPRIISSSQQGILSPQQIQSLTQTMFDRSEIYLPLNSTLDRISVSEIYDNPMHFYEKYISYNRPCIIQGACDDSEAPDKWRNPKNLLQVWGEGQSYLPISLTPDGFADSIKGQYFVEPAEIKSTVKALVEWPDGGPIPSQFIPYIQQQNSNLTNEQSLSPLLNYLPQEFGTFVSQRFFQQKPDATNFWMGYQQSVSALHKDPYENFYTTIVGQKHFTLLPPISILALRELEYKTARWKIKNDKMEIQVPEGLAYPSTKWIASNPDRFQDYELFPEMKILNRFKIHTILRAGETLYLPSLWYHQVSQSHSSCGDPYTIATNHWYDMRFGPSYTLYETARAIRGLQ